MQPRYWKNLNVLLPCFVVLGIMFGLVAYAPELYRAMQESAQRLRRGDGIEAAMAAGAALITNAGFKLDYFEVRHAETLAPVASVKDGPMRILVAATIGRTPTIDRTRSGTRVPSSNCTTS